MTQSISPQAVSVLVEAINLAQKVGAFTVKQSSQIDPHLDEAIEFLKSAEEDAKKTVAAEPEPVYAEEMPIQKAKR